MESKNLIWYTKEKIIRKTMLVRIMDNTTKKFLAVLKAALMDEQADLDTGTSPEEWQRLLHMASIHNVLPLFYEAVYASPALQQAELPSLPMLKRQVRQQVMLQTVRTSDFFALNRALQAAGVKPLIVKGLICRTLYPKPDCRKSSDEDILIPAAQFDACHRAMLEFGMHTAVEPHEMSTAYEVPYRKAESPLYIELHKHLFPPESDAYGDLNRFFAGVFSRAIPEEIQGNTVYTMAHTDHLFYLICHAFKHFLHSGFGIRQVCDIVLYANEYGSRIDWVQILNSCREIRADKFAAAIFRIGQAYLVFDPEKAAYPSVWRNIRVNELPMLEDLLASGIYGGADGNRRHSSNITLDAVAAQKQGRKAKNAVLTSAFPPASRLEGRYPYLKKHPWLLPAAWCSRLWTYSKETRNSKNNNAADAVKIGNARIELMKEYGIVQ